MAAKLMSAAGGGITLDAASTATDKTVTVPADTGTMALTSQLTGFRNRIINGSMSVDQRNSGASVATTAANATTYTIDRWAYAVTQASKFTVQQTPSATETNYLARLDAGFKHYLACTSTSSYSVGSSDAFSIRQIVEGINMSDWAWGTPNAKTVTLSFWVYSSLTGTFGASVFNGSVNRCYPFSYVVSTANAWTQVSVTIPGDQSGTWATDNTAGLYLNFSLGAGSTFSGSAGVWGATFYNSVTGAVSVVGTSGATWYITGVQIEKGSVATSFEHRPYVNEFMLCQRYYQKVGSCYAGTVITSETSLAFAYSMFVPMRANPASDGFAGSFHRPGIAFYSVTSIDGVQDANGGGYSNATISAGAGGGTIGQLSGRLSLKAEL